MEESLIQYQDVLDCLSAELRRPLCCLSLVAGEEHKISLATGYDLIVAHDKSLVKNSALIRALAKTSLICLISITDDQDVCFLFDAFVYIEKIHDQSNVYFCSNTYWYAKGEMCAFEAWGAPGDFVPAQKNSLASKQTRRYFFTKNKFLKRYQGQILEAQKAELENEVMFLTKYSGIFKSFPKILQYSLSETENWSLRERIQGRSLTEMIQQKISYDPYQVIADVLNQLAKLEHYGLYQTDLRTWNVILAESGDALLVDYGAIKSSVNDVNARNTVFFIFIMFCYQVIYQIVDETLIFNPAYFNLNNYPRQYRAWLQSILSVPVSNWSFRLFAHYFNSPVTSVSREYRDDLRIWLDQAQLRFHYYSLFPPVKRTWYRNLYRLKEMLHLNPKTLRVRYFERRFFKYFESHFTQKHSAILAYDQRFPPRTPELLRELP